MKYIKTIRGVYIYHLLNVNNYEALPICRGLFAPIIHIQ